MSRDLGSRISQVERVLRGDGSFDGSTFAALMTAHRAELGRPDGPLAIAKLGAAFGLPRYLGKTQQRYVKFRGTD
jgi:hypothetical protein